MDERAEGRAACRPIRTGIVPCLPCFYYRHVDRSSDGWQLARLVCRPLANGLHGKRRRSACGTRVEPRQAPPIVPASSVGDHVARHVLDDEITPPTAERGPR